MKWRYWFLGGEAAVIAIIFALSWAAYNVHVVIPAWVGAGIWVSFGVQFFLLPAASLAHAWAGGEYW